MSVTEQRRALALTRVVAGELAPGDAAAALGCSERHLWRLLARFRNTRRRAHPASAAKARLRFWGGSRPATLGSAGPIETGRRRASQQATHRTRLSTRTSVSLGRNPDERLCDARPSPARRTGSRLNLEGRGRDDSPPLGSGQGPQSRRRGLNVSAQSAKELPLALVQGKREIRVGLVEGADVGVPAVQ
jgi:Homeodomain-like domain